MTVCSHNCFMTKVTINDCYANSTKMDFLHGFHHSMYIKVFKTVKRGEGHLSQNVFKPNVVCEDDYIIVKLIYLSR